MFLSAVKPCIHFHSCSPPYPCHMILNPSSSCVSHSNLPLNAFLKHDYMFKRLSVNAIWKGSDLEPEPSPSPQLDSKTKAKSQHQKAKVPQTEDEDVGKILPTMIPKKKRRGRRSEAAAVEDFIRDSLEKTFASIREQDPEILKDKEHIFKEKVGDEKDSDSGGDDDDGDNEKDIKGKKMVVEEDDPDWPLDADVGWGTRASEYFEKHPIRNIVGEDGVEIDWEGEIEDNWVKEINCMEWEAFAFHPSPLIVLVFERYNRASDNWKVLKELEKATMVYWSAKDRLPPRAVKIDINIERDLAYALKIKDECPQILFLRGHRILYREKQFRTSDELVQMIAHFYYNAKKPTWMRKAASS